MAKRKHKHPQEIPAEPATYFQRRMADMGITDTAEHGFRVESLEYPGSFSFYPLFAESPAGDIQINYPCLYGGFEPLANDPETEFTRLRFKPENQPAPDVKYYQQPKSGVHIFLPPAIIEKFAKREKITTLHLVEGEFKAMAGSLAGLDIVGIGGKDLFRDDEKKDLHPDIIALITHCNIENINLLLDADVFQLTWNPEEEPGKDLGKRLSGFYSSVRNFREVAKGRVRDVYFSHIRSHYLNEAKGLDDLLLLKRDSQDKVIDDLNRLKSARVYFDCINISAETPTKVKGYFMLNLYRGSVPSTFYGFYSDIIKDREFTFLGARYRYDKTKDGLALTRHEDSFKFIRVACDFYKVTQIPNVRGLLERKLTGWKAGEITRDYVNTGFKNFFDTINKYEAFCNVPENDPDKYQQVISGCYNLYFTLEHKPEAGTWPNTEKFLKHLFGTRTLSSGHSNYDLALDYLTILYTMPVEKLPVICLVSKEKETGKSTFLFWLREIFNENATIIGNREISDTYNDDYITRLVIGVDESFIEKKLIQEQIKSMVTNPKAKMHGKYASRHDVPFVGKFVMTSNNEDNFILVDDDENRFWVNKVPTFAKGESDPDLLKKMTDEIPAFLHFLKTRQILHPRKTRLWFDSELLETEALDKVRKNNRTWLEQELRETITDQFFEYQYHAVLHHFRADDAA